MIHWKVFLYNREGVNIEHSFGWNIFAETPEEAVKITIKRNITPANIPSVYYGAVRHVEELIEVRIDGDIALRKTE